MTLSNHFFQAPLCKASFEYFCGWLLIILGYCFVISIVFANPAKMNYGSNKGLIEGERMSESQILFTEFKIDIFSLESCRENFSIILFATLYLIILKI